MSYIKVTGSRSRSQEQKSTPVPCTKDLINYSDDYTWWRCWLVSYWPRHRRDVLEDEAKQPSSCPVACRESDRWHLPDLTSGQWATQMPSAGQPASNTSIATLHAQLWSSLLSDVSQVVWALTGKINSQFKSCQRFDWNISQLNSCSVQFITDSEVLAIWFNRHVIWSKIATNFTIPDFTFSTPLLVPSMYKKLS